MSALTHIATIRMMEQELLALECSDCGHRASAHSLRANQCAGTGAWSKGPICRCVRWVDPESDLLAKLDARQ